VSGLTFLTKEQCIGDEQLKTLKKRGCRAAITDFAILSGGIITDSYIYNSSKLEDRTAPYWTTSGYNCIISENGVRADQLFDRYVGARPALSFSSIKSVPNNGRIIYKESDGVLVVEYGYYPQKAASKNMQKILDTELKYKRVKKTENSYTADIRRTDTSGIYGTFSPKEYQEYEYRGKRYVKVLVNFWSENFWEYDSDDGEPKFMLSNGVKYGDEDRVWLEVEPVKWLIDEESNMMYTDKLIFAGVPFLKEKACLEYEKPSWYSEDFEYKANIKKFMDQYLVGELEQSISERKEEAKLRAKKILNARKERKSRLEKLNPDTIDELDRVIITDTERINDWIESGESVLLRGPSGIGKTERIKESYPDAIYLKLTNNMFPEKVVGSVNLQTGQSIPPDFAVQAIMQAATEKEKKLIKENIQNIYDIADTIYERSKKSDEKIVILLDELLNVRPAVQSLVYSLVLNKTVEIGKGLKLPKNVVLVATGNQKKYSSVAEDLAEPLEKRFDHILDMEPKVGEWITEYAIPKKVHPRVIGYMLAKYNNSKRSEELSDIGYFYEEPEVGEQNLDVNGCRGKTNDPRGWTSVSNTLYEFEKNLSSGKYRGKDVEDIIKMSLNTKLRDEWAEEFFDYYNLPTLTPEEVTQGLDEGYTQVDLPRNTSERFAYMTALITADENQVEACRDFIRKYCDPEYLSIYDIYWAGNDARRMEKIAELQDQTLSLHSAKETEQYVQDGLANYNEIGQDYNDYLNRNKIEESAHDYSEKNNEEERG